MPVQKGGFHETTCPKDRLDRSWLSPYSAFTFPCFFELWAATLILQCCRASLATSETNFWAASEISRKLKCRAEITDMQSIAITITNPRWQHPGCRLGTMIAPSRTQGTWVHSKSVDRSLVRTWSVEPGHRWEHSFSQKGIWESFGHPNSKKGPLRTPRSFCEESFKMST